MALAQDQVAWVNQLAGNAAAIVAAARARDRKDGLLADAFSSVDAKVPEIRLGEGYAMEMRSTGLYGFLRRTFRAAPATKKAIAKGGPDAEFDTGHDLGDAAGLTPEQATELTKAHAIIVDQVEALRRERTDEGKPLFTDAEIAKEIWEPLVRRKIIPENAVSDRYSEVSQTFGAASEQYDLRLAAYTESVSTTDGIAAKLGMSSEALKAAGGAAANIMGAVTAVAPGMQGFDLLKATNICTAVTLAVTAPLDIASAVLKDKGLNPKNVEGIAKTVAGAAAGWVTAAFSIKFDGGTDNDKINQELGKAINAGLKIGLSATVFAAKVAQGGDKAKEAFDELGMIAEQCCVLAGSAQSYGGGVKNDNALAITGRRIKDAIIGAKEIAVIATAANQPDPLATVTKALQGMVKVAIDEGAQTYALVRQTEIKDEIKAEQARRDAEDPSAKEKHKQDAENEGAFASNFLTPMDRGNIERGVASVAPGATGLDVTSMLKLAQTMSRKDLEAFLKDDPKVKGNAAAQKLMLAVADKRDQELEAAGADVADDAAKEAETFRALLSGSEGGTSSDDVEGIELLILQIKKDQMIIKLAESLVSMPAAAVAAFLPPASIAVDAIQLAVSMRRAAIHLMAWVEWNDNLLDAKSAMSVQAAAMANRAGISQGKAAQEAVRALEAAVKLVGDALGTTGGPFAPIGIAVSKGVSAASALKDIIVKIYDEAQLKRNWAKYQRALENPDDRKAIRAAIKGNATLAKYVIAYGAVVAEDPIAKNALRKCGLSAKVLQSPKTNEQKVVAYLEALYADDPVVLERLDSPPKWHPGPIELTAASVAAFSHAGQNKAKPALSAPVPDAAKGLLAAEEAKAGIARTRGEWEAAQAADPPDDQAVEEALEAFVAALSSRASALGRVVGALTTWQPTGAGGKPHEEGLKYRASLLRMARGAQAKAQKELLMYDDDPI